VLKEARYGCWAAGLDGFPEQNKVLYIFVGNACYFTGVEREMRTSTINAAESIIRSICQLEQVQPFDIHWYDLQTSLGYGGAGSRWHPGTFVLSELMVELDPRKELYVRSWPDIEITPTILAHFHEQIGENPRNIGQVESNPLWRPRKKKRA